MSKQIICVICGWILALLSFFPAQTNNRPAPRIAFTDITATAGITFKHVASPEKKYIVESMSGGVAMFDYDNDGDLDLYLVNSLTVDLVKTKGKTKSELYRNDGNGKFTEVGEKAGVSDIGWGMGVAVGDYNNDGFEDLYVSCLGPDHLLKNNGNGTFTDVTAKAGVNDPRWTTGASFIDYDNDGDLDLFVTNYVDFDINNLPEFGQGKTCTYKSIPVQCGPRGLKGAGDSLFRNNGDGTFTNVSKQAGVMDEQGFYGLGILTGDFDDDGLTDIFVANDSTPNFHYRNKGNGTFEEIGFTAGTAVNENGSEQGSMGVTAGDYDHDGKLDIFITNFADEYNTLYHNDGKNSFTDLSYAAKVAAPSLPYVGWGTKFFDYDNDGWVDLFVANGHVYPQLPGYRQPRLLHRNNRDSTFTEISAEFGAVLTENRASRGVAFGDIDNDGDIDLLIADLDGPPQLLRNDGGNANNSILVKLVGVKSNRSGIGARVTVVSGDLSQIDEVRSGDSYISQSDLRLHFGLEKRTKVDSIQVRWPSGAVDKISGAGVNRIVTIKEGQGKVDEKEYVKQPQVTK